MIRRESEILFLFPNIDRNFIYHLGTSYIIAYLKQKGMYSKQFVCNEFIGFKELIEKILAEQSHIVGFTCYDSNYGFVKLIAQQLKIKNSDILNIVGGPTATFSDKIIMQDTPEIDICVRGEGEQAVDEIIQEYKNKKNFNYISGITYRKGNKIIPNIDRPLICDKKNKYAELDLIPSPYMTGVLDPLEQLQRNGDISVLTARGCVFKCIYCNFASMSRYTVRCHSVERVISELKIISKLNKQKISFKVKIQDDTFTLDNKRVREFCGHLIKENLDLNLWIDTRADFVNKELLELLFKAGVRELNFGLESAVPKVLYNIKKVRFVPSAKRNFEPEKKFLQKVKKNVKLAKDIGFKISVSTMLGLPGETFQDGLKTISFVKSLKVDEYCHNKLKIYSGTELRQTYKKYNLKFHKMKPSQVLHNPFFSPLIYSYAVHKVPLLSNRRLVKEELENMRYYLVEALMGIYRFNKIKKICQYPRDIILANNDFHFDWLKENITFQTRFIYSKNINNLLLQENSEIKELKISIFGFYPEFQFFNVLEAEERLCEQIEELRSKFLCLRFAKVDNLDKNIKEKRDLILYISKEEDLEALKKQALFTKNTNTFGFTNTNFKYFLLDACRWSIICPATKLPRWIINNDGNILPCFHGKAIGRVGDTLERMRENIVKLDDKEKRERKCNKCPARDTCSKCPFIGSIGIDRYCKTKREFPYINTFINLLQIIQKTRYYYEFTLRNRSRESY